MSDRDDLAQLLARVALQDQAAFERLYRRTSGHLLGIAVRITNRRDQAEELLQEAFVNIWHGAHRYNAALAQPMTWLINIVRNKAIDAKRAGATEQAATTSLDDDAHASAAGDGALEPQRLLEESLVRHRIRLCMAALNATQRQALALAYYRGMAHSEIAESLGTPLGTAKAWVRRGLERLKNCLDEAGWQESS